MHIKKHIKYLRTPVKILAILIPTDWTTSSPDIWGINPRFTWMSKFKLWAGQATIHCPSALQAQVKVSSAAPAIHKYKTGVFFPPFLVYFHLMCTFQHHANGGVRSKWVIIVTRACFTKRSLDLLWMFSWKKYFFKCLAAKLWRN